MSKIISAIIGPRVSLDERSRHMWRYAAPTIALSIARVALLISIFLPYWKMELIAPQYPNGLHIEAFINRLTGDVREIDSLNHYIGMRPLGDAAQLERSLSIAALLALVILVEGATYLHSKWAALIALPVILFPAIFLGDLYYWMSSFGNNLDPTAAMSNSIKPFTPPILGTGMIGQFVTIASAGLGLKLAAFASSLTVLGLWLHRRAYKPLLEAQTAAKSGEPAS